MDKMNKAKDIIDYFTLYSQNDSNKDVISHIWHKETEFNRNSAMDIELSKEIAEFISKKFRERFYYLEKEFENL